MQRIRAMNLGMVLISNGEAQILSLIVEKGVRVLIHTELHGERSSIILISEFDRLINPEKEVSFTMFDRSFTIHFLARLNPLRRKKITSSKWVRKSFYETSRGEISIWRKLFLELSVLWPVSSISNIINNVIKNENKRHYSEEPRSGANWLRYRSKRSPRKDRATVNYVHVWRAH